MATRALCRIERAAPILTRPISISCSRDYSDRSESWNFSPDIPTPKKKLGWYVSFGSYHDRSVFSELVEPYGRPPKKLLQTA